MAVFDVYVRAFIMSVTKLLAASALVTVGGCFLTGFTLTSILAWMIVTTVVQVVAYNILQEMQGRKNLRAEFLAEQVAREAAERRLPYPIKCSFCGESNDVGISFIQDNQFVCKKCKGANAVHIQFLSARVTEPMSTHTPTTEIDIPEL